MSDLSELYVKRLDYHRDQESTEAQIEFDSDPNFKAIPINYLIALELIQCLADAGGVELEILGPRKI